MSVRRVGPGALEITSWRKMESGDSPRQGPAPRRGAEAGTKEKKVEFF